jgi:hypothetical protein
METPGKPTRKGTVATLILLILALLSIPLGCWGAIFFSQPLDLFNVHLEVINQTDEVLYLTLVRSNVEGPVVVEQPFSIRQQNTPLAPGESMVMTYDAEYDQLAGVAVCRADGECRLADRADSRIGQVNAYTITSFEELPSMPTDLRSRLQAHRQYSPDVILAGGACLAPLILLPALLIVWVFVQREPPAPSAAS